MTSDPAAWYHGRWSSFGGLVTVEDNLGLTIGVLAHVVRHSPGGFVWGDGGGAAADLARSLLIDALGDLARCSSCEGTGHVGLHPNYGPRRCLLCDDGYAPDVGDLYQRYKWAVIASFPYGRSWRISRAAIVQWVRDQRDASIAP